LNILLKNLVIEYPQDSMLCN